MQHAKGSLKLSCKHIKGKVKCSTQALQVAGQMQCLRGQGTLASPAVMRVALGMDTGRSTNSIAKVLTSSSAKLFLLKEEKKIPPS